MLNPFQIYPSASKSIIRHLGVSHLPKTHCSVVLVGRLFSEHHCHMLIEKYSSNGGFLPLIFATARQNSKIKLPTR